MSLPTVRASSQSYQYRAIQSLYEELVEAIIPEVQSILPKAWSKRLIGKQLLDLSHDVVTSGHQKASKFMSAIDSRIKLDSGAFDTFLTLLGEIESLQYMKERLEQEVTSLNTNERPIELEATVQLPKLDLAEDLIELLPVRAVERDDDQSDPEVRLDMCHMTAQHHNYYYLFRFKLLTMKTLTHLFHYCQMRNLKPTREWYAVCAYSYNNHYHN